MARVILLYVALWGVATWAILLGKTDREAGIGANRQLPPPSSAVFDLPFTGINVAFEKYEDAGVSSERARELKQIGFEWVRQRIDWASVEPRPGTYVWDETDAVIDAIVAAGLEPVVVLDGSPAWARSASDLAGEDNPRAPPADPANFARFSAAFAGRYGDQLRYYQLWDEPNIYPHWGNRWVDPVEYAQMLRLASAAVRAADPDSVILLAALAPTADRGHLAVDEVYFLQRLYASGAAPYFDAVAVQPLGFGRTPEDPTQQRGVLNLHRALLVRRAMVAAGDGQTPIIAARYGWNRRPHSPWGAVTSHNQSEFAAQSLSLAYRDWPWMSAMAWAVDRPAASLFDPVWGFSLDSDTADSIYRWNTQRPARNPVSPEQPARSWPGWALLAVAGLAAMWRTTVALQLAPWRQWRSAYLGLPPAARIAVWALLLLAYSVTVWPPLVVLCWALAALLILAQPSAGLWLAAAVLPFYFQHKELDWGNLALTVAPVVAATLCLLPALLQRARYAPRPLDQWDLLALGWLVVVAVSATGVWHWPAYWHGAIEAVAVPLVLFWAVRAITHSGRDRRAVLLALVAGGVLVSATGLADWLRGGGTAVDNMRRLVGPFFSANHAALYLERSLFIALGLTFFYRSPVRWLAGLVAALLALALALTASRGAILLGLPAGMVLLAIFASTRRQGKRETAPSAVIIAVAVLALLLVAVASLLGLGLTWERFTNSATVEQRWLLWQSATGLWRDYWFAGIGPGGFFWRFPAYIPIASPLDPNLLHPHNLWLEYATTGGLLALAWLAAAAVLVIHSVRAAHSQRRARPAWPAYGLLAALAAALAHAQVDAFAALPDLATWNWIALGILAAGFSTRSDRGHHACP